MDYKSAIIKNFSGIAIGKNEAMAVVGGEATLYRLIGSGDVRFVGGETPKNLTNQHFKWKLDKASVYLNMKP